MSNYFASAALGILRLGTLLLSFPSNTYCTCFYPYPIMNAGDRTLFFVFPVALGGNVETFENRGADNESAEIYFSSSPARRLFHIHKLLIKKTRWCGEAKTPLFTPNKNPEIRRPDKICFPTVVSHAFVVLSANEGKKNRGENFTEIFFVKAAESLHLLLMDNACLTDTVLLV